MWADVKIGLLFWCVVGLPASWVEGQIWFFFGCIVGLRASRETHIGHRASDSVVASKVWGCVGVCQNLFFLLVHRVVACVEARLGRRFSDSVFAFRVWWCVGGC